jgi:hypothetical protein
LEKCINFGATPEVVALLEGKKNKSKLICDAIVAYLTVDEEPDTAKQ